MPLTEADVVRRARDEWAMVHGARPAYRDTMVAEPRFRLLRDSALDSALDAAVAEGA